MLLINPANCWMFPRRSHLLSDIFIQNNLYIEINRKKLKSYTKCMDFKFGYVLTPTHTIDDTFQIKYFNNNG